MSILEKFKKIGTKPNYLPWENNLVQKINFISIVGFSNVITCYFIFHLLGIDQFKSILLFSIIAAPIVFYLNSTFGYLVGAYSFFFIGAVLATVLSVQLGPDSYFINFYFPMTLTVIHYFGRKETLLHTYFLLLLFFISMLIVAYCYSNNLFIVEIEKESIHKVKIFNLLLSYFTAVLMVLLFAIDNIKSEKTISKMLKEKDVLVAEVFHRVKNNMNIITSLLNLKKESSDSEEVKDAIEECKNRVYAMALVHQKIFTRNNTSFLNFSDYIKDFINEITNSIDNKDATEISIKTENIELPLNYAIPLGLILNELITNAHKHAKTPSNKLLISVEFYSVNDQKTLIVKDNGPGIQNVTNVAITSLGMELIDSLCNQIDGSYRFENNNGLVFNLQF